ncbi:hypothetical protein ACROYT_G010882 [Oculina patagonica]
MASSPSVSKSAFIFPYTEWTAVDITNNSEFISKRKGIQIKMSDTYQGTLNFITPVGSSARHYTCGQCGLSFVSQSELESHQSLHPIEKLLRCKHCGMYFQEEMKLKAHAKKHEVQVGYLSPLNPEESQKTEVQVESSSPQKPGKSSGSKVALKKRVKSTLPAVSYKCTYCDKSFKNQTRFKQHERKQHTGFRTPLYLEFHSKVHQAESGSGENLSSCNQCGKCFESNILLRLHTQRVHGDKKLPFQCTQCNGAFSSAPQLVKHRRTHAEMRPHKCSRCHMSFKLPGHLEAHIKSQHGENPLKCTVCEKIFLCKSSFRKHRKIHPGMKAHKCKECQKDFVHYEDLRNHEKIHTERGTFKCTYCDGIFLHQSSLIRHTKTHLGIKPHKCKQCCRSFARPEGLRNHERLHTGEKPFKCTECDMRFALSTNCNKHMRRIHRIHCKKYVADNYNEMEVTECSQNEEGLSDSGDGKKIIENYSNDVPHKCIKCGQCFPDAPQLTEHVVKHCDIYCSKHDHSKGLEDSNGAAADTLESTFGVQMEVFVLEDGF